MANVVRIRFEIANDVQFARAFQLADGQFADLTAPLEAMGEDFYSSMVEVFAGEGVYEERTRWQDLSPSYAKWKARHYPGRKILERTGRMRTSLTLRGGMDSVYMLSPSALAVGTLVPYAMYHQTGTKRMPMRKIIELTAEQKKRWVQILHRYMYEINKGIERGTKGGI
jgi:phage gpG-like protein